MNYYNTELWEWVHTYDLDFIISSENLIKTHNFIRIKNTLLESQFICKNCNESLANIIYVHSLVCEEMIIKKILE